MIWLWSLRWNYSLGEWTSSILNGDKRSDNSLFSISSWTNSCEVILMFSGSLPSFRCSSEAFNSSMIRVVFSRSSLAWSATAIYGERERSTRARVSELHWPTLTIRSISFLLITPSLSWSYVRKTYLSFSRRLPLVVKANPMRNSRWSIMAIACLSLSRWKRRVRGTHRRSHRYFDRMLGGYLPLASGCVRLCHCWYCEGNWLYRLWRSSRLDTHPNREESWAPNNANAYLELLIPDLHSLVIDLRFFGDELDIFFAEFRGGLRCVTVAHDNARKNLIWKETRVYWLWIDRSLLFNNRWKQ